MKLSQIASLAGPLVLAGTAGAEIVGLTWEQKPNGLGILTHNVYALFDERPGDFILGVFGTPDDPLSIDVVGGTFYQHAFGGNKSPGPALCAAFPSLCFDTFVTINKKLSNGDATSLAPGFPGFGPSSLVINNGSGWFVELDDAQGNPDASGRVLLAQLSTQNGSGFTGTILLSGLSAGTPFMEVMTFDTTLPPPTLPIGFFTNASLFDTALLQAAMVGTAEWNFAPNTLGGGEIASLDDPLDIATHAQDPDDPWGALWPQQVNNVQFSSNTTPRAPLTPRGADGLAFAAAGYQGLAAPALLGGVAADSLDLILGEPGGLDPSAVGLQLVRPLGTGHVVVTVYDQLGDEIGSAEVVVTAGQPTFLGIQRLAAGVTIGRIDVWDTDGGVEGLASIALKRDNCIFFADDAAFEKFATTEGTALAAVETFEESNVATGFLEKIPEPLQFAVPDVDATTGIGFPNGLAINGLVIQTNVSPGPAPAAPNPSGDPDALFVTGAGVAGTTSRKVGEHLLSPQHIHASLDLIVTAPCPWDCGPADGAVGIQDLLELLANWGAAESCDVDASGEVDIADLIDLLGHWGNPPSCTGPAAPVPTAVSFELSRLGALADAGWIVTIFDRGGLRIGQATIPGPGASEPVTVFVGVSAVSHIGRINIYDEGGLAIDAVDDIQLWE